MLEVGKTYEVISSINGENQSIPNDWEFVDGDKLTIVSLNDDVVVCITEFDDEEEWAFNTEEFEEETI